jgi:hypothetical protein
MIAAAGAWADAALVIEVAQAGGADRDECATVGGADAQAGGASDPNGEAEHAVSNAHRGEVSRPCAARRAIERR